MPVPPESQGCTIISGCKRIAEDALATITFVGCRHVFEPPRCEKSLDHRRSLLQQFFPEMLAGFEVGDLFGRHMNLFAGFRVPTGSLAALPDAE